MSETAYSKKLIAGNKTYFFDVKETKSKQKYLKISETRLQENGERMRNDVAIFSDHIKDFQKVFEEALVEIIKK